jgi:hypothetical protein
MSVVERFRLAIYSIRVELCSQRMTRLIAQDRAAEMRALVAEVGTAQVA